MGLPTPCSPETPYVIEPIGRNEPTEHGSGVIRIKPFRIGDPIKRKNLPLAALPLFGNEILCAYRTKRRPAIIISKGGSHIDENLTSGKAKSRTNRTVLVAPSFSVRDAFSPEF